MDSGFTITLKEKILKEKNMIPKTIHYCWFGGKPKPKSVKKCIKSWKKFCPDYKIIEWNESNYDITKNMYMQEAYIEKKWGFVPDYARLDIIYHHGGIYLDTDVQMIKSFDDLLSNESFFGFEDDLNNFSIALGLGFGSCKGNLLIKRLLDSYATLSFYNNDGSLNLIPAPIINLPIFEEYGFIPNNKYQNICGNVVFPTDYFDPKSFVSGMVSITPNTYSIHQYDASWFDVETQNKKLDRWKKVERINRIHKAKHLPNRILMSMLGDECYERLKKRIKSDKIT